MRPIATLLLCFVTFTAQLGCSVNILENFANKTSNEAIYQDALRLINDGFYQEALDKLALLTGSFASERKVKALKASGHAGLCGLAFLPFVQALEGLGTTRLFPLLTAHFAAGSTSAIDSCREAETLIESIGDMGVRTSDENMMLVLIALAKIGNILNYYADSNNDGTVDLADGSVCADGAVARNPGSLAVADQRQLAASLSLAIQNIQAVSSTVDLGTDALNDIDQACDSLPVSYRFCDVTDPTAFTTDQLKAIKTFIRENSVVGLGTCNGDPTVCVCL